MEHFHSKIILFKCLTTGRICSNYSKEYTKDFIRGDGGDFYNRETKETAEILRVF